MINKSNSRLNINIYINNHKIEQVYQIKYLGVIIDCKLQWKEHIKSVENKIAKSCGLISKIRHYVDQESLRKLYYAHVYSHLQYAVLAWGGSNMSRLHNMNKMHNKIIRLMSLTGSLKELKISADALFKSAGLLKIREIYNLELAKFMYRVCNNSVPMNQRNMYVKIDTRHRYPTTSSRRRIFYPPRAKSKSYLLWISNVGIKLWESIDDKIKALNYYEFKKQYKTKLIKNY